MNLPWWVTFFSRTLVVPSGGAAKPRHYVTNNLLIPFTKPWRLSYADVAKPCRASWFVPWQVVHPLWVNSVPVLNVSLGGSPKWMVDKGNS